MDLTLANTLESQFGPASEPIDIPRFLKAASGIHKPATSSSPNEAGPSNLYSVSEIRDNLSEIWNRPKVSAHLQRSHTKKITTQPVTNKRKRKAHEEDIDEEVKNVQDSLESIVLQSWSLNKNALFVRPSKHSDHNVLVEPRPTSDFAVEGDKPHALLTISIHSKVPWAPSYVTRTSQHALISTQTLGDLLKAIACVSNVQFPEEDELGVVCIEDKLYTDGDAENNSATKLLDYLKSKPRPRTGEPTPITLEQAKTSISDTQLQNLLLRLHEPYWFLHHGNCEHFIVVDQIRLLHPSDPRKGYPLTLFVPPSILDLCRGCKTVPATVSVIGDIRLGETPCLMCSPCWRNMGEPRDVPGLKVIQLAREEKMLNFK